MTNWDLVWLMVLGLAICAAGLVLVCLIRKVFIRTDEKSGVDVWSDDDEE